MNDETSENAENRESSEERNARHRRPSKRFVDEVTVEEKPPKKMAKKASTSKKSAKNEKKPVKKREKDDSNVALSDSEYAAKFESVSPFEQIFGTKDFTDSEIAEEKEKIKKEAAKIQEKHDEVAKEELKLAIENYEDEEDDNPYLRGVSGDAIQFTDQNLINDEVCIDISKNVYFPARNFYQHTNKNQTAEDRIQLTHVPYVSEFTSDMAVCAEIYKHFPNGIHGYLDDEFEINDFLLFELMKNLLPEVVEPDLFYYALYRCLPSKHSQKEFGEVFPELCKKFAVRNLSRLEPWKKKIEAPILRGYKFASVGNYHTAIIPLPRGVIDLSCNSDNCFEYLSMAQVKQYLNCEELEDNTAALRVYANKGTNPRNEDDRLILNEVFGRGSLSSVPFCQLVQKLNIADSCAGAYVKLLEMVELPSEEELQNMEPIKPFAEREKTFRTQAAHVTSKKQRIRDAAMRQRAIDEDVSFEYLASIEPESTAFQTVFKPIPCSHFGPCGIEVEGCTCDNICSYLCSCDINCSLRHTGCQCLPGNCRTNACPCVKSCWECHPSTCKSCLHEDHESILCGNYGITGKQHKEIGIMPSKIAGWGAISRVYANKGDFLGEYFGEIISEEETERRGHVYIVDTSYIFDLSPSPGSIDATRVGNEFRFVNHSTQPNCFIRKIVACGELHIAFYAKKTLKPGMELTFDYAYSKKDAQKFFDKKPEERFPKVRVEVEDSESSETKPAKPTRKSKKLKAEVVEDSDDEMENMCKNTSASRKERAIRRSLSVLLPVKDETIDKIPKVKEDPGFIAVEPSPPSRKSIALMEVKTEETKRAVSVVKSSTKNSARPGRPSSGGPSTSSTRSTQTNLAVKPGYKLVSIRDDPEHQ